MSFICVSVDELASLTVGAVPIGHVLFAVLGLVQGRYVLLLHNLLLSMCKGAFVTEFTFAVELKILAHFSTELMDIGSRWGKVVLS